MADLWNFLLTQDVKNRSQPLANFIQKLKTKKNSKQIAVWLYEMYIKLKFKYLVK